MYATDPQYATGWEKSRLAMLGYKNTGEQNTWGKINSWLPGVGIANNLRARRYSEKIGATDTWENIKEDTDNRLMKQGALVGGGLMAAGGFIAAPAIAAGGLSAIPSAATTLASSGLGMTSNFAGMLAFDQDDTTEESNYIYR
jgi:hypothetical protein